MNMEDDTWLETVNVQEELCRWDFCTKVATHMAVMSKPCEHLWLFCLGHRDHMDVKQNLMTVQQTQWTCPIGIMHYVGLVERWESIR